MENTDERMMPQYADDDTFWEHLHRYRFASSYAKSKNVLDIACGEGYGSASLKRGGANNVIGVDISPEACSHASKTYGIETRVGNAEKIPAPNASFDLVVSFETVEHVANPENFLKEIDRVLRSRGTLIISTPDQSLYSPEGKPPNPYHCSEMTRGEFTQLVSKHFCNVKMFGQRPQRASWWSPISLIAQDSAWDGFRIGYKLRRKLWKRFCARRICPCPSLRTSDVVSLTLNRSSSRIYDFFDWSSVRPMRKLSGWNPVFLIAVARKRQ